MILELKDIKKSYTNARQDVFNLLDGVSLDVESGCITALIGGNGAGKTTLFNIISGFEKDFSGRILFEGKDITQLPAYKISQIGIGRLFQGRQLMDDLSLMDNMKIASADKTGERPFETLIRPKLVRESERKKEQKAIEIFKTIFGEDNKYLKMLEMKASELSYGEQRLIAMARLLMDDDRLLLLDEPTSGVNPKYIDTFKKMIRDMVEKEGKTVLLIEHNMSFVHEVSDKCFYLSSGKIVKSGTAIQVLDDPAVRNDYLGL